MRTIAGAFLPLALTVVPGFAGETFESTVSGTVTIAVVPTPAGVKTPEPDQAKGAKTLTVRLTAPAQEAPEPPALQQCGMKWKKKLAEYEKKRKSAEEKKKMAGPDQAQDVAKPGRLTRADYRSCMYQCLGDTARHDPECEPVAPADAQAAPTSGATRP